MAAWPLAGANCHNLHWHEGGLLYLTSQKVDATLLARHAPLLQVQVGRTTLTATPTTLLLAPQGGPDPTPTRSPNLNQGGIARLDADGRSRRLWAAGGGYFSKGLVVVGQVAYFGLARQQASARSLGRPAARRAPATTCLAVRARAHLSPSCACAVRALCTSVHVLCMHRARTVHTLCAYCQAGRAASRLHRNRARAELAAFDLRAGVLLWRQPVPHLGLINAIAAPGLCASAPWCTCAEPRAPAKGPAAPAPGRPALPCPGCARGGGRQCSALSRPATHGSLARDAGTGSHTCC